MHKIAIVINPKSGAWKRFPECFTPGGHEQLLRKWFSGVDIPELTIRETRCPGDGAEQARIAYSEGYKTIVAAGGDGTIREVIEGMSKLDDARLGILPVGTANVLARSLQIPVSDHHEAARIVTLAHETRIDIGICNGRAFALHAGIGLDGAVVRTTSPRLKRMYGRIAYVMNSVRMALRMRPATIHIRFDEVDGMAAGSRQYEAYQVLVANISEYGGNMRIGDHVSPTDGLLDVVVCERRVNTVYSALLDGLALAANRLTLQRGIEYRQARSVYIESSTYLDVQLDGDSCGGTPVNIQVARSALRIIVPEHSRLHTFRPTTYGSRQPHSY
jgi:YegS/Rv2252/BmrU family lipid kinase